MNDIFHKGEYHIQEVMGVRKSADTLSSNIKNSIPSIAAQFLENLNFCVISIALKNTKQFTFIVYDIKPFITVIDDKNIVISLTHHTYIHKEFLLLNNAPFGFIGLDFERKMRIRINGNVNSSKEKLEVSINQIYSNCPKYIAKKFFKNELKIKDKQKVEKLVQINSEFINLLANCDTFFISSKHNTYGLDVSYKGGEKGFISVISNDTLQFVDLPGNNLFNTIGNIYSNPNIQLIFIDFQRGDIYHISAVANIIENKQEQNKTLTLNIKCNEIILNKNGFLLEYEDI